MSHLRIPRRVCRVTGKTRFECEQAARDAAAALRDLKGAQVYSYRCDECGSWHMTSRRYWYEADGAVRENR